MREAAGVKSDHPSRSFEITKKREGNMKIVRYGLLHQEKPGIVASDGSIRDLSGTVPDITGESLSPATLAPLRNIDVAKLPVVPGAPRLGPCVGRVGKF